MKVKLIDESPDAERWLPSAEPDGSELGINYADAYIKPMNKLLEDGTQVSCKRRGLKLSVQVGEQQGEAIMRRLEHGPDVQDILQAALAAAFAEAGTTYSVDGGAIYLEY